MDESIMEPVINLGQYIRLMARHSNMSFQIVMDNAYDHNILGDIDPDDLHIEFQSYVGQVANTLETRLSPAQEEVLDDHFINILSRMIFSSNMIESAGAGLDITLKLCQAVFRGEDVPDTITKHDANYKALQCNGINDVLQSYREIVQHAKAARYIILECLNGKDLSEDLILETHRILTHKVNTEQDMPWTQYSGVYRQWPVSTGLHQYMGHDMVPGAMQKMIQSFKEDINKTAQCCKPDPVALAAKYCHTFVSIHPFLDGNGRICRLILNAILLKDGGTLVCIGETEEDKQTYLKIASAGCCLEGNREDMDGVPEDLKPKYFKKLASFTLQNALNSVRKLKEIVISKLFKEIGAT